MQNEIQTHNAPYNVQRTTYNVQMYSRAINLAKVCEWVKSDRCPKIQCKSCPLNVTSARGVYGDMSFTHSYMSIDVSLCLPELIDVSNTGRGLIKLISVLLNLYGIYAMQYYAILFYTMLYYGSLYIIQLLIYYWDSVLILSLEYMYICLCFG